MRAKPSGLGEFESLSDALAATADDAAPIEPDTIVLEARSGAEPRPTVRIFLGSEASQWLVLGRNTTANTRIELKALDGSPMTAILR